MFQYYNLDASTTGRNTYIFTMYPNLILGYVHIAYPRLYLDAIHSHDYMNVEQTTNACVSHPIQLNGVW